VCAGAKDQVTRFRGADGGLNGSKIAHFTARMTSVLAESARMASEKLGTSRDFALGDDAFCARVYSMGSSAVMIWPSSFSLIN